MTGNDEAANPLWDPFGLWREFNRATEQQWGAASAAASMPTASTPLQWLLDAGRTRLIGRRVSWSVGGVQLEFDLEDIGLSADSMVLGAGQADEVTVSATDVVWGTHAFPAARATFHNVHTRPGKQPALVTAPIDLHLLVTAEDVAERIKARVPWLLVEITDSGELRARYRKRSEWGWVEFAIAPQGQGVAAKLRALTVAGRCWRLPSRMRSIFIPLSLPADARLREVLAMPHALELRIRVDERRFDIKGAMSFLSGPKAPTAAE